MKSKKRSAASSKSRQLEERTLFVDRSLGRHYVADALRKAGALVEVHDTHFQTNAPDEEWLREVGRKNWIVLTKDARIRHRPNELSALKEARVVAVVLTAGNLTGPQMANVFVKALRAIQRRAGTARPPALFTFGRDGKLKPQKL
ncbi:MAG TPA: hypothetical protein VMC10_02330 [Stellaceae bacterium]|nr:hypothetical protein [Stellaceae bacterium]